jgi:hypothetical protein
MLVSWKLRGLVKGLDAFDTKPVQLLYLLMHGCTGTPTWVYGGTNAYFQRDSRRHGLYHQGVLTKDGKRLIV